MRNAIDQNLLPIFIDHWPGEFCRPVGLSNVAETIEGMYEANRNMNEALLIEIYIFGIGDILDNLRFEHHTHRLVGNIHEKNN